MRKYLIAGPSCVWNIGEANRLKALVWTYLTDFIKDDGHVPGVICADDTATGRYAKTYAGVLNVPVFPYSAGLKEDILGQAQRDLIAIRNMKMIAEPEISRAILFTHTNECGDIIQGLQAGNREIEITRVMG